MSETSTETMPKSDWCPIGSLNLHTYNFERTECIWCGPGRLAGKPGHWESTGDGYRAWSATEPFIPESIR